MNKTSLVVLQLTSVFLLVAAFQGAPAAVPEMIQIQGTLEAPGGGPLTGTYFCHVRIWDASEEGLRPDLRRDFRRIGSPGVFRELENRAARIPLILRLLGRQGDGGGSPNSLKFPS